MRHEIVRKMHEESVIFPENHTNEALDTDCTPLFCTIHRPRLRTKKWRRKQKKPRRYHAHLVSTDDETDDDTGNEANVYGGGDGCWLAPRGLRIRLVPIEREMMHLPSTVPLWADASSDDCDDENCTSTSKLKAYNEKSDHDEEIDDASFRIRNTSEVHCLPERILIHDAKLAEMASASRNYSPDGREKDEVAALTAEQALKYLLTPYLDADRCTAKDVLEDTLACGDLVASCDFRERQDTLRRLGVTRERALWLQASLLRRRTVFRTWFDFINGTHFAKTESYATCSKLVSDAVNDTNRNLCDVNSALDHLRHVQSVYLTTITSELTASSITQYGYMRFSEATAVLVEFVKIIVLLFAINVQIPWQANLVNSASKLTPYMVISSCFLVYIVTSFLWLRYKKII